MTKMIKKSRVDNYQNMPDSSKQNPIKHDKSSSVNNTNMNGNSQASASGLKFNQTHIQANSGTEKFGLNIKNLNSTGNNFNDNRPYSFDKNNIGKNSRKGKLMNGLNKPGSTKESMTGGGYSGLVIGENNPLNGIKYPKTANNYNQPNLKNDLQYSNLTKDDFGLDNNAVNNDN